MLDKYIDKQAAIEALGEEPENWINVEFDLGAQDQWRRDMRAIKTIPLADAVSWAYLERYAEHFCADVSFPEFIREAKAFLKESGGFQEGARFMTEYIGKQAAIKANLVQPSEMHYPVCYTSEVTDAPPADVRHVVRGKWIKIDPLDSESNVKCSECESVFDYIDGLCYLCVKHRLPPFCPNCGADMMQED